MEHAVAQVAEDIYQVQVPLPFPLRIVNCYLLADEGGWTLVDTGLSDGPGRAAWETAFAALGVRPDSIRRIILTHAHPDHYGGAGWLRAWSGAPISCSPAEQAFAQRAWAPDATNERAIVALFLEHGMPRDLAALVEQDVIALRGLTQPPPDVMDPLEAGTRLQIGRRTFETIAAPGHSDGHLVFYCRDERLLLCGDAVLLKITPNISCWPACRPDPLADYLRTLAELRALDVALALPGHRGLITDFAGRLGELQAHHAERLARMASAVGDGATAYEVCLASFSVDSLSSHQIRFAMAETIAHLEYLVGDGLLERRYDGGVTYRRIREFGVGSNDVPSDSVRS